MKFRFIMGSDMSKEWFNWAVMNQLKEVILEGKTDNTVEQIGVFVDDLLKELGLKDLSGIVLIMEHTGIYCNNLARVWSSRGGQFSLVPANKISKALAGSIGWDHKTDEIDAQRIAEYGARFEDKLKLATPTSETLVMLRKLRSQRDRLLKAIQLLVVPIEEDSGFESSDLIDKLRSNQNSCVAELKASLKSVEKLILKTIKSDAQLLHYFERMKSVPGVGNVTAVEVLIVTEAFRLFGPDQAKAFKRYARTAPMPKQSGKWKRKNKTTNWGSKKLNSVFTMGALSMISSKGELTDYYWRKIKEGKTHKCVLNALKAKIIDRVFAVVRKDVMYQK